MSVQPTPEELMAYADGQLAPDQARRVEQAVAASAELRAIVEDHRRTRAAARKAFDAMAQAPMSAGLDRLSATLSGEGVVAERRTVRWWAKAAAWPAAAAACLAVGIVSGTMATASNDLIRWQDGPVAGTQLASMLEQSGTGEARDGHVVVASFRAGDGRYCRQFEIGGGEADGVACREARGWAIIALAERPGGPDAIQVAGGESAVALAIAGLKPGARIEGEAERRLIASKWR
jgi:hypothetical protein